MAERAAMSATPCRNRKKFRRLPRPHPWADEKQNTGKDCTLRWLAARFVKVIQANLDAKRDISTAMLS